MRNKIFKKLENKANRIKEDVIVLYLALKDKRVPMTAKLVIALVVGYALSPIDFIPDFIPVLGYLDDIILLPLGIYIAVMLIPANVLSELRVKAKSISILKKSRIAGAVIVTTWIILAVSFIKYFFLDSHTC
jgi:uncharacterized membrane protein YkvA (DUF1232 family)